MRKLRKRRVTVTEIAAGACDCCGTAILDPQGRPEEGLEGISVEMTGGYHSRHVGDMVTLRADVCERCLTEWFKTFKSPPRGVCGF